RPLPPTHPNPTKIPKPSYPRKTTNPTRNPTNQGVTKDKFLAVDILTYELNGLEEPINLTIQYRDGKEALVRTKAEQEELTKNLTKEEKANLSFLDPSEKTSNETGTSRAKKSSYFVKTTLPTKPKPRKSRLAKKITYSTLPTLPPPTKSKTTKYTAPAKAKKKGNNSTKTIPKISPNSVGSSAFATLPPKKKTAKTTLKSNSTKPNFLAREARSRSGEGDRDTGNPNQTAQTYLTNLQKLTAENDALKLDLEELKNQPNQLSQEIATALKEANQKIRELEAQNKQLKENITQLKNQAKNTAEAKEIGTQTEPKPKHYLFTCDICEQNKKSQLHLAKVNGLGIDPNKQNKICDAWEDMLSDTYGRAQLLKQQQKQLKTIEREETTGRRIQNEDGTIAYKDTYDKTDSESTGTTPTQQNYYLECITRYYKRKEKEKAPTGSLTALGIEKQKELAEGLIEA
ncbi:12957_t:CDS:2, partial [Entrophospora sp. SA101]